MAPINSSFGAVMGVSGPSFGTEDHQFGMFATSCRFLPSDHQPSTGRTTIYPSPAATDLRNVFVGMIYMPLLHDAGSRNTHKVACDLIGLGQVVAGFELTILILCETFGTCVDLNFFLKDAIYHPSPFLRLEFLPSLRANP